MKKILLVLAVAICASSGVYAQMTEKELKKAKKNALVVLREAKAQLGESGNVQEAKKLVEKAMANEFTKDNAETWNVAGDVYSKLFVSENYKATQGQPHDTVAMYDYLMKMYDYYNRCDSLQQIPNEKGKTSTACRDKNASNLDFNRTMLINGGIFYYNNRRDYAKAYDVFAKYFEICNYPMLEQYNDKPEYKEYATEFAYYPSLAAMQMQDYKKVLRFCDLGVDDEKTGETCYRFKCQAYENLRDTANWLKCLQEGITKFPNEDYYYMCLLSYYDNTENFDEMEKFINEMMEIDSDKAYNHYVKGYLRQSQKRYTEAIESYKNAIAKDSTLIEAYINQGLCYLFEANNYMDTQSNVKFNSAAYKKVIETENSYYRNALPLFEKVREMAPDDVNKWGLQLYSIYYKLNMTKELNRIETILKAEGLLD